MNRKSPLPYVLIFSAVCGLIACTVVSPTVESMPTATASVPLPSATPLPLSTQTPTSTLLPLITSTPSPLPTSTATVVPTLAATLITPIARGDSLGALAWSPDARWLPVIHFSSQTLQFYDTRQSVLCDFPEPIHAAPNRFLAWLKDGRVVVPTAKEVLVGRPCETFTPAGASEILALDHVDPSFSPGGLYQVVYRRGAGASQGVEATIELKELASGKVLNKTTFIDLPRGGGPLPGGWLDPSYFLIAASGDQGPLLVTPNQPAIQIAPKFFQLPPRPGDGTFDMWQAIPAVTANPAQFHLILVGLTGNPPQSAKNPLQLYHSETGQVETLPYLANQVRFSNDGHWLVVNENSNLSSRQNWFRPIDPPGAPFELLTEKFRASSKWSPDGTKVIEMALSIEDKSSVISIYSFPQGVLLSAWQAPGYELYPIWSPDGKTLTMSGKLITDPSQQAMFLVRLSDN